jgi:hypothetical protein
MYILFAGTTDHKSRLTTFLQNVPHTLLQGTSVWQGKRLDAQVIIFFDKQSALLVKKFLKEKCHQKDVPLKRLVAF